MKRLAAVEKGALALAAVFIICGAFLAIHPMEIQVSHPSSGYPMIFGSPPPERVPQHRSRIYGIACIALGLGIGWLVFYRRDK